ncbi:MAG: hypothetical protein KBD76_02770 [Bacteriovorax sp.]|nr:hypothetical protein [Bacteriovorax sp.]
MFIKFFVLILLTLNASILFAESNYEFQSELLFKHDQTISPGVIEAYSMQTNSEIKLFIGTFEKRSFWGQAIGLTSDELKNSFLEKAALYDSINRRSDRKVVSFKMTKDSQIVKILIQFSLKKNDLELIESNSYILTPNSSAFASALFPFGTPPLIQKEILKGIESFQFFDSKKSTVFYEIRKRLEKIMKNIHSHHFKSQAFSLLFLDQSFAQDYQETLRECNGKKYVRKGSYTTRAGSALYDLDNISKDLKQEIAAISSMSGEKEKSDETQLNCLMNFYKEAKTNASDYWAQRGTEEGCIIDGEILKNANTQCSDSTLKEMNKSLLHIEAVESDLQDFLQERESIKLNCIEDADKKEELNSLAKFGASVQQTFCCSLPAGGYDKGGALYQLLNSEDENFKSRSASFRVESCLSKTIEPSEDRKALGGDCIQNLFEGIGSLARETLAALESLADVMEVGKALASFVTGLPESGRALAQMIGEQVATKTYAANECMSPYESKLYICRVAPTILATLLGPGMIKKFAEALISKSGKTAIAQMVTKAASENKKLQVAATASRVVVGKITRPVLSSRFVKPSAALMKKVGKALGTDLSTPVKKMIIAKSKKVTSNLASSGRKILGRPATTLTPGREMISDVSAYQKAVSEGNTILAQEIKDRMLNRASTLSDAERIKLIETLANKGEAFSKEQARLILDAHEVGRSEGRGFGTYTPEEIAKKARLLSQAGIEDPKTRRLLMESGLTGSSPKDFYRDAISAHFSKAMGKRALTPEQTNALLDIHGTTNKPFEAVIEVDGRKKTVVLTPKQHLMKSGFSEQEADQALSIMKAEDDRKKLLSVRSEVKDKPKAEEKIQPPTIPEAQKTAPKLAQKSEPSVGSPKESEATRQARRNFSDDPIHNYSSSSKKRLEEMSPEEKSRASKEAKGILEKYFGKGNDMDIENRIPEDGRQIAASKKRLADAQEAMNSARPNSEAALKAQREADKAAVNLEAHKTRCQNWLDLYKSAYGVSDYVNRYERLVANNCR